VQAEISSANFMQNFATQQSKRGSLTKLAAKLIATHPQNDKPRDLRMG